ncbi:phycocyanin alpha phycocyanobilin lyase [Leptolyngbya sp. 'hensonii']|uniref:phycobilisome degradation protein NblB n=1 Tax=Leptolyngbya sp. 'hensonii' TaxID=1922337 RepID=UPI00094F7BB9|nr:HEAT repeat domain-containing protein [Leptolyngbya sp. 'hensonii']OLP17166.1 phycocyanin alpha phycocyanobilin lyase [Leptolyngbya sp. 'hensonii']
MSINPESVQELLASADFSDRMRGINQLRQLDPGIAFELIQSVVNDSHVRVRYAAISQLASLGTQNPQQSMTILRDRLLNEPEPDVQAAAADSIGALKLTDAFPDLEHLYQTTPEWLVKFSIVAALGELGDLRSLPLLEDALKSESDLLMTAAIGSLGELGDVHAVSLLIPLASHPDWQIRHRVAKALGQLGCPDEAREALQRLAQDEFEQVANEAQASLTL